MVSSTWLRGCLPVLWSHVVARLLGYFRWCKGLRLTDPRRRCGLPPSKKGQRSTLGLHMTLEVGLSTLHGTCLPRDAIAVPRSAFAQPAGVLLETSTWCSKHVQGRGQVALPLLAKVYKTTDKAALHGLKWREAQFIMRPHPQLDQTLVVASTHHSHFN